MAKKKSRAVLRGFESYSLLNCEQKTADLLRSLSMQLSLPAPADDYERLETGLPFGHLKKANFYFLYLPIVFLNRLPNFQIILHS